MQPEHVSDASVRRAFDASLLLLTCAYAVAALVGLPLFGDGGYYYFKLATDSEALLPNLRYTAVLPQLPGLVAAQFTADPLLLRHVFSISYQSLPWLSLVACWLVVRHRMPRLILPPLLSLSANLLNFSSVSELLSGLYLVWPLVLAMALTPERAWVRVYAFLSGPLLLALHPITFALAFGLAAAAAFIAWRQPNLRLAWRWLAGWVGLNGLGRLLWTVLGANAYERGTLTDSGMVHYLITETVAQHLLLVAVLLCGLVAAGAWLARPRTLRNALTGWGLPLACLMLTVLAIGVSAEFVMGQGIKLKAGATFVVALLLMMLAFLVGGSEASRPGVVDGKSSRASLPYQLIVAAILIMVLAKSAAWWTATRGLQDAIADSNGPCIHFAVDRPYGLQWPWMNIVDDWVAPVNGLAFRPRVPRADGQGVEPIPLLLPGDGCDRLERTGEAYLTEWMYRPWAVLNARFGPLRPVDPT
ncbi:MAG: hypothetical protein WBG92_04945 [Thiohalocapsa sp.]